MPDLSFCRTTPFQEYAALSLEEQAAFRQRFVSNSNAIENIFLEDFGTVSVDSPEEHAFSDHAQALEKTLDRYGLTIHSQDILELHGTLMEHLRPDAGSYRRRPVYLSSIDPKTFIKHFRGCIDSRQIPRLMEEFVVRANSLPSGASLDDLFETHAFFETLHPFSDGNGRTGRLALLWLSLRYNDEILEIDHQKRPLYYDALRAYKETFKKDRPDVRFAKDKERFIGLDYYNDTPFRYP
jgi:Fic family protein